MKKTMICLNGIKSVCFMLFACLVLSICTTSCSSDEFETNLPEEQKQYTNAELIDQALKELPQTRANGDMPIVMVTTNETVFFFGTLTGRMIINWGDGLQDTIIDLCVKNHIYTDNKSCHVIFFQGMPSAMEELWMQQNGLIYLDITNNTKLTTLNCSENLLESLDFSGCDALEILIAHKNKLSSVDITPLRRLRELHMEHNEIIHAEISNHPTLHILTIGNNPMEELNVSNNPQLALLFLEGLQLQMLNNLSVNDSSFINFSDLLRLEQLDVSGTSFISLDISSNSYLRVINISHSDIKRLNISNGAIASVDASYSELTDLIYTSDKILNLDDLHINVTPFESFTSNLYPLLTSGLPDRKEPNKYNQIVEGHLYTTMLSLIAPFSTYLANKNWVVN